MNHKTNLPIAFLAFTMSALLTACGGGGSGSKDDTGNNGNGVDITAPTIVTVTPAASATGVAINAVISVTFSEAVDCATVTAASFTLKDGGDQAVNGTVACTGANATFTPAADLAHDTAHTATLTTAVKDSAGNALAAAHAWSFTTVVEADDTNGNTASTTLELNYPFLAFTNGQAASVAIGQPNLTSKGDNRNGLPAANTLNLPYGHPAVHDGVLYVGDGHNHRVLGFHAVPEADDANADFVLGQPDFTSNTGGTSATAFKVPENVVFADGKMFVNDYNNHRILIWNSIPTSGDVPADVVVGQQNMNSAEPACAANRLRQPEGLAVAGGKLIVCDSNNYCVLIWNSIPTSHNRPADIIIGQPDFDTCEWPSDLTGNVFREPTDVWSDGTRLLVVDKGSARVLLWNTFPTVDGQGADVVLGQPDMASSDSGTTAQALADPYRVHSNGNQIFVTEASNNRLLIRDAFPTANHAPANRGLGQANFTSYGSDATATTMNFPSGILAFDDKLLVADTFNSRLLIFQAP